MGDKFGRRGQHLDKLRTLREPHQHLSLPIAGSMNDLLSNTTGGVEAIEHDLANVNPGYCPDLNIESTVESPQPYETQTPPHELLRNKRSHPSPGSPDDRDIRLYEYEDLLPREHEYWPFKRHCFDELQRECSASMICEIESVKDCMKVDDAEETSVAVMTAVQPGPAQVNVNTAQDIAQEPAKESLAPSSTSSQIWQMREPLQETPADSSTSQPMFVPSEDPEHDHTRLSARSAISEVQEDSPGPRGLRLQQDLRDDAGAAQLSIPPTADPPLQQPCLMTTSGGLPKDCYAQQERKACHQCPYCRWWYVRRKYSKRCMNKKTNGGRAKPEDAGRSGYPCTNGCGKTFTRKENMPRHLPICPLTIVSSTIAAAGPIQALSSIVQHFQAPVQSRQRSLAVSKDENADPPAWLDPQLR